MFCKISGFVRVVSLSGFDHALLFVEVNPTDNPVDLSPHVTNHTLSKFIPEIILQRCSLSIPIVIVDVLETLDLPNWQIICSLYDIGIQVCGIKKTVWMLAKPDL